MSAVDLGTVQRTRTRQFSSLLLLTSLVLSLGACGGGSIYSIPIPEPDDPEPDNNANEAPEFASDVKGIISVVEDTYSVGRYTATDVDAGDMVVYSLKGDDADKFVIRDKGVLSFITVPDYEALGSKAGTNVYKVTIVATDKAGAKAEHALIVMVTDVSSITKTGTAGDDTLTGEGGSDTIDGGAGNDTIDGGAGNDSISDSSGDDVYLYSRRDGVDEIADSSGTDTIRFDGIDIESIVLEFSAGADNDMIIRFRDNASSETISTTDIIMVKGGKNMGTSSGRIERFQFGTEEYDVSNVTSVAVGTGKEDSLNGGSGDDWISLGGKDDTLEGGDGDDYLFGGADNDLMYGRSGNDYVFGGTGNDTIFGQWGDDYLFGGLGNDEIYGYTGNDTLDGGAGDDIYYFYQNDGQDVIKDTSGSDTINLGNVAFTDVVALTKSAGDLVITFNGYTNADQDKITIKSWSDSAPIIETFRFGTTNYEYELKDSKPTLVKKTSSSLDEVDEVDVGFVDVDEGFSDLLGLPRDFSPDLL